MHVPNLIKAVNTLGVSSTYVTATRTIVGAIEPPADVTDFSCNILGQEAHLSWTQIPDLDLAYYQIRYSTLTDGTGDWANSVSLVEKVSRPATSINVPARVGTYLIKAVDKLGNFSSNPYDSKSTSNSYGQYGSKYSPDSINNSYGQYGSEYSNDSPNKPYATNPPVIIDSNEY